MASEVKRGPVVTYDRVSNIQPEDWNRKIVEIDTNADCPFTAIMDRAGSETTQSRIYHWWQKDVPSPYGTITGVYTDGAMTAVFDGSVADGQILYVKMPEADASHLVPGQQVTALAKPDEDGFLSNTGSVNLTIKQVSCDGVNSRVVVAVRSGAYETASAGKAAVLVAEGAVLDSTIVSSGLSWFLSGDNQPENGELPDSVFYEPEEFENRTAIIMAACEMSGSELKELERVDPDKWTRAIKDALRLFRMKREYAAIFSVGNLVTNSQRKQVRYYKGIRQMMGLGGATFYDVATHSAWEDVVWDTGGGLNILDDVILESSRIQTGYNMKTAFIGDLGMQAINRVVKNSTHYDWSAEDEIYGVTLKTLKGTIKPITFVMHPLFNKVEHFRRSMLVTEMPLVKRVGFRPMQFISGKQGTDEPGYDWVDGRKAGWFVEETVQMTHAKAFAWVDNLGHNGTT